METPTTAETTGAPAVAPQTPAPAPAEPTPTPATTPEAPATPAAPEKSFDELMQEAGSAEDLEKLLEAAEAKKSAKPAATQPPATAPEAPAAPSAPSPEAPKPEDSDAEPNLHANRPRLTNLPDGEKAIVNGALNLIRTAQAQGREVSFADAVAIVSGKTPAASTASPETPAAPEATSAVDVGAEYDQKLTSIAEKITAAKQKFSDARRSFDENGEVAALSELQDLLFEQRKTQDAKTEALAKAESTKVETARSSAFTADYEKACKTAARIIPGFDDPASEIHTAIRAEISRIESDEPEIFNDPNYPIEIALRVQAKSGRPAAPAPAGEPTPQVPPARSARPAEPELAAPSATTVQQTNSEDLERQINGITNLDDLVQLADAIGTKAPEPSKRS